MKNLDDSVEEIKETINRRGFVKVPIIEGEEGKESSFRRVAKFLLLIGVEQASKILPLLPQDQIERLMIEIASIRYVDPAEATVILAEFQEVKGMHGLAILQHDVVGDVHDVVDGTDAGGAQTVTHPAGRGLDADILGHGGRITGAQVGIADLHGQMLVDIADSVLDGGFD